LGVEGHKSQGSLIVVENLAKHKFQVQRFVSIKQAMINMAKCKMEDYIYINSINVIKDETRIHIVETCYTTHIILHLNIDHMKMCKLENHCPSAMAGSEIENKYT
jgi:hypothetical protein